MRTNDSALKGFSGRHSQPMQSDKSTRTDLDKIRVELAGKELDARFIDGIESGEINGDILVVDEIGRPVKDLRERKTIFELS